MRPRQFTPIFVLFLLINCGGGLEPESGIYRANLQRTGYIHEPSISNPPRVALKDNQLGSGPAWVSPLAIGNDLIIAFDFGIEKVNAENGEWIWSKNVPDYIVAATPMIVGRIAFFPSGMGYMNAYHTRNGRVIWSRYLSEAPIMSSPCTADDLVIVVTAAGGLRALSQKSGIERWSAYLKKVSNSSPSLSNGVLYVGSHAGAFAFRADNGEQLWFSPGFKAQEAAAISDGAMFLGTIDGSIVALQVDDGSKLWDFDTGAEINSSPGVDENSVYIGNLDGRFFSIDKVKGSINWTYQAGDTIRSSPLITNEDLYFGCDDHKLYCLNKATGELRWTFDAGDIIRTSPIIHNGKLIFLAHNGDLYALK